MATNNNFRTILDNIKSDIRSQLVHLCTQRNIVGDISLQFQSELMANNLTGPGIVKVVGFNHIKECLYVYLNKENEMNKLELNCVEYDYRGCSSEQLVTILTALENYFNIK